MLGVLLCIAEFSLTGYFILPILVFASISVQSFLISRRVSRPFRCAIRSDVDVPGFYKVLPVFTRCT